MRIKRDPVEYAWAAGVFDGEGSFQLSKPKTGREIPQPRIHVGQSGETEPELLNRLQAIFSLGGIYGPYKHGGPNRKPVWQWWVWGYSECMEVYQLTQPWLTKVKIEQAESVFAKYEQFI